MANLFNYDVNLQPAVMDIRSETLEPISSSTNRFVFRLDQYGQLDSNSVLLFKPVLNATGQGANEYKARVNPWGGGLLAIKRAVFQVGDYILNDIQDVGRISNLVDLGGVNVSNKSKYNSHYFLNNFHTKVLESGGSGAGINTETAHGGEGSIVYDRDRSAVNFGEPNNNATGQMVNNCIITNNADNNHQIGIPLGNLFPCLKGQELPLFLFQDYRILITIEFHTVEKWCSCVDGSAGKALPSANGGVSDVKLQVDYIVYPSEVQNQLREQTNQQGGLSLSFFDVIKIEKNIPASGASGAQQTVEHRLGFDNKEVHKIYMMKKIQRGAVDVKDRLFLDARCDGMNQEEYNVNIDGVDVFQEAKHSPSSQYDELSYCLGADFQVPRPIYFNDENTIMSRLADSTGGLLGKNKPLCLDLSNGNAGVVGSGRSCGAYPIIWKYKRRPTANVVAKFDNGTGAQDGVGNIVEDLTLALDVDYFVYCSRTANIKSSPSGTQVMVSY